MDKTTLTLNDVNVDEGAGTATIGATLDHTPQTELIVTLSNGATVTFGTDYVAGTVVQSTEFNIQGDDVYNDGESYNVSVTSTTGGNFESLDTTDTSKVTVSDTIDKTTLTLNDVNVDEGAGTATIGATLDHTPQTELIVTLSNGATVTFGTDYVAGTVVQSTEFNIQGDDVYNDGESYNVSVTSTTGGNFESLDTTDTSKVTVSDTIDKTTLTLNDVNVDEGAGTATIGATLDHTPQTELIVTLSNGATVTFGTDYVAGTVVQSTEFNIQGDDVYNDGESYNVSVTSTTGGNFESLDTTDTSKVTVSDTIDKTTLTLNDVNVDEGAGTATIGATLDHTPQTELIVTLSNGATVTFGTDYVAGTVVQSTEFNIQGDDVYNDGESYNVSVTSTTGGNFESLDTTDTSKVTVSDTIDKTTLTLNDVNVDEGAGTATIGATLDHTPQTELIVTLSNGATVTFGTDYVAGTVVQSTEFNIQGDDVYNDGESYNVSVTSTTGGNFESLDTTDTSKVTVSDTIDKTTLTLNDVNVDEGAGTATIGATLDHTPQTELIVTLSNGATVTFGTDYVAGTVVQSTEFNIQGDDVYNDGESYNVSVTSTTGGNFESLDTTDTSKVTVSDTIDKTTLTLNDVNVDEGAGTATIGATLDHTPQTELIVTLSNGATVTFGTDYVAGTVVQSTEFNIQGDDVYNDGESYNVSVTSTTGGNFESLDTTDTSKVTVSDTIDKTTLTLNDVNVDEGAGTATIGATLDHTPQTELIVTLSNGATVTFGTDYVAGTVVQSTEFNIQGDDVYNDGESYNVSVTSTTGGNFESLDTTDTSKVTVSDTIDKTTLTLNDVNVDEGAGTATIGATLDHTPQTELIVTLSNGATVTFGTDYVAGTVVQSTEFNIQGDDVYNDGESYNVSVTSTTGGNFESLDTTDTSKVTVSDTIDKTTLTLNDVNVDEGAGTATIGATLDHTPQTELIVTLSNGATVTFGTDYVAGTVVQSTEFNIQGDDVYNDGESYNVSVTSTTGGNFESLDTTDTSKVTVSDTIDKTTLTLNDVNVDEGAGTATIGATLDHTPQTELIVTLSNGATVTFGTDYVAGTVVQSTEFNIQGDDVYNDGESYNVSVTSTTGGNFESLDTTDTSKVTVSDTIDKTTLTLNDVNVDEGAGTATIGATLDHTPQTELIVTLSNGATVTFGTDYVAGTVVQSTEFNIQGDDVYNDGESYNVSVTSTTGGNFESLDTTDTSKVTVSDTIDKTTLTLNDVNVDEGAGTATIGATLDHTPQTELIVTLSNGATVTFGTDYVAGTVVQSTEFNIQGDDVYNDGESYNVSVTSTTGGNFESLDTTDTSKVTVSDTIDKTTLTLNDVNVDEGAGTATIGATLDHTPQTELIVTLSNGATVTFGTDYVAGTVVQSTEFNIQGDDVYNDGESYNVSVTSTTGGNFESLDTTDTSKVTVSDTIDKTTLTLNDVNVDEGAGTATIGATLDHTPQTELIVTLSNGATVTFGTDYVAGTVVQSTEFNIQGDDVYNDGESYNVSVTSTTGGNFESLDTTDTSKVTVSDTIDKTTLTLNDVNVDEGAGTATIGATLDHTPQTELIVTLSNGATVTFGTDYVAGTVVQSTEFNIQGDDVYNDGESYNVSVTSTTGGNFESLDTTDTSKVTVSDTIDKTTLTLNDVNVDEGAGTATIGATLDHTPQTELIVTLSNGATVTFGTDYVAGTVVQSTEFNIQGDDVYNDGESYNVSVTSTTGGNFESLDTTDTSKVTVSDTIDKTTLTLNDVNVDEGAGTATIGATLDHTPQTELIVTLSNGATVTFGTDYVAGTVVQSTEFNIQGDDVYNDGESYNVSVTSTTGGNFESLDTTDTSKVTVSDTIDKTTLTLNDVNVDEGAGTATIGATLDHTPQTELIVTLSNGATVTFGTDYVAGTVVQSTEFNIQGDDVYNDGESYNVSVTSTTGGNFESLDTTDTSKVTVSDTIDKTTLTLNDVNVDEGAGTATIGATLDHTPQTELIVTLSNGATVTFGTDYVAGTVVQSTEFNIQGDDVYNDGESYNVSVTSTTGGNFESLDTTDTSKVTVSDTIDKTTLTLNDVNVDEGAGTATIGATLDHTPQTELIVTLSNGATVTFGTDYVAGTVVQSTEFNIQGDDVYNDGESYNVSVTSTTGGNFESLDTTDTSKVTVSDTIDKTTLTLNDVNVDEGAGTATIGATLDHTPQTELIVTLSNGATVTFGTDYVAGTVVQSTEFNIQGDDVYNDGESYNVSVTSTTGGNFESLDTTDTSKVTVSDTIDKTTLTLNDVNVDEGAGTATIGATLDHTPQTELIVTLSNGATVTFGTDYVAGTVVQSTEFNIQGMMYITMVRVIM
ncbi:immunoglobulin-like domain-containing protein [Halarcobacter ebronensis]|uniref:immunoglobulin-like domain-containing protein n=1 Tax=Halarcobacter ebronensis TaxID=1462615 RepID=UPI003B524EF9